MASASISPRASARRSRSAGSRPPIPLDPQVQRLVEGRRPTRSTPDPRLRRLPGEGQLRGPAGPADYGRTHADGANMLADALAPHGGIVIWRAFVYQRKGSRRPRQAGLRRVQAARRPVPRQCPCPGEERRHRFPAARAFHPLFGAMPQTPRCWRCRSPRNTWARTPTSPISARCGRRCCDCDTYGKGKGSTVARVVDGSLDGHAVDRHGGRGQYRDDRNWTGSHFQPGQLVRLRPPGLGPGLSLARHRRRMGAHDLLQRSGLRRAGRRHDDGVARGGGELHDAARPRIT